MRRVFASTAFCRNQLLRQMSGLGNIRPSHGGRASLARRSSPNDAVAEYEVRLVTPSDEHVGIARITRGNGVVELQELDSAPEWLAALAKTLLRGAWREQKPWPRRLTRWRAAPGKKNRAGATSETP
jgi:hypothetical protein